MICIHYAEVAKWHTRWFQVPVTARLCGFKSHPLHQKLVAGWDCVLCTTMLYIGPTLTPKDHDEVFLWRLMNITGYFQQMF